MALKELDEEIEEIPIGRFGKFKNEAKNFLKLMFTRDIFCSVIVYMLVSLLLKMSSMKLIKTSESVSLLKE